MEKKLIDIAYDLAKTKYAKKPFTFTQLWKELIKKAKLDAGEQKQVGHIYACMLQDHRFIFIGNNQWKVREFLTLEEQMEYSNALYDFSKDNQDTKKTKDEDYSSEFNFDDDEQDEYKQHAEVNIDDENDDEDEIDNESESSESDEDDEETEDIEEKDE